MAWSSWCLVITQGQADSTARGIPALSTDGLVDLCKCKLRIAPAFLLFIQFLQSLPSLCNFPGGGGTVRCFVMFSVQGTGKTRIVTNPLRSQDAEATSAPRFASSMEARSHRCEPRRRSASGLRNFGASGLRRRSSQVMTKRMGSCSQGSLVSRLQHPPE